MKNFIWKCIKFITYPVWRPLYFLLVELHIIGWTILSFAFMIFMLFYSEKTVIDKNTTAVVISNEYVERDCWTTHGTIWNGYSNVGTSDRTCDLEHYLVTMSVHSRYVNKEVKWRYNIDEVFYNEGATIKVGDTLNFVAYIKTDRFRGDTLEMDIRERHFWE